MSLADHLTCPVCIGRLQHTHMTACGHRYCESCIRECIDRLRRCPCCNAALQHDQLIKDAQFDALIGAWCDAVKMMSIVYPWLCKYSDCEAKPSKLKVELLELKVHSHNIVYN